MSKKQVYVTRNVPGPCLSMLSRECQVTLNKKPAPPSRKEILKNAAGKAAILCMLSDSIDAHVMDAAGPALKVISSYSTGFEHIDVTEATSRGIYVTFTADILAEATADLTFALLLACARRIVDADRLVRQDKWRVGWMPDLMLGHDVHGATLGVIGLGRIGSAVARRARGFGMKILYYNRNRNYKLEQELGASYSDLDRLLGQSDFVCLHTSSSSTSRHLIDMSRLRKMKNTAFLINTSRGPVVNEADLAKALREGLIAGAGLDVFEKEPLRKASPLVKLKNVVLLPHIGSATIQTRSKMGEIAAKNLLDVLNGRKPDSRFLVNPEVAGRQN
ncbi:MAG: D-glycerate dehydrogenase [Nitrososphaera sp.]|nr:D-glycerate dehydrogenase [Nitrososphaera sp.]